MKSTRIAQEFCLSLDLAKRSARAAIGPMNAPADERKKFATLAIDQPPQSPEAIEQLPRWLADVTVPGARGPPRLIAWAALVGPGVGSPSAGRRR